MHSHLKRRGQESPSAYETRLRTIADENLNCTLTTHLFKDNQNLDLKDINSGMVTLEKRTNYTMTTIPAKVTTSLRDDTNRDRSQRDNAWSESQETERIFPASVSENNKILLEQAKKDIATMNEKAEAFKSRLAVAREQMHI